MQDNVHSAGHYRKINRFSIQDFRQISLQGFSVSGWLHIIPHIFYCIYYTEHEWYSCSRTIHYNVYNEESERRFASQNSTAAVAHKSTWNLLHLKSLCKSTISAIGRSRYARSHIHHHGLEPYVRQAAFLICRSHSRVAQADAVRCRTEVRAYVLQTWFEPRLRWLTEIRVGTSGSSGASVEKAESTRGRLWLMIWTAQELFCVHGLWGNGKRAITGRLLIYNPRSVGNKDIEITMRSHTKNDSRTALR